MLEIPRIVAVIYSMVIITFGCYTGAMKSDATTFNDSDKKPRSVNICEGCPNTSNDTSSFKEKISSIVDLYIITTQRYMAAILSKTWSRADSAKVAMCFAPDPGDFFRVDSLARIRDRADCYVHDALQERRAHQRRKRRVKSRDHAPRILRASRSRWRHQIHRQAAP